MDSVLHVVKLQPKPLVGVQCSFGTYVLKPVIISLVECEVTSGGSSRDCVTELLRHDVAAVLEGHPRVHAHAQLLFVDGLVAHVEFVLDLEGHDGSVLHVELLALHVAHHGLVGPDAHLLLAQDAFHEVDRFPVDHVGDVEVRHPDGAGHVLDHVHSSPVQGVPVESAVQPAQHQLAVEVGRFQFVVHLNHVFNRH